MEGVAQNTPHHKYDVAEHTLRALKNVKRDKILRHTMLFHDMGKPMMKTTDENGRIISVDMHWSVRNWQGVSCTD